LPPEIYQDNLLVISPINLQPKRLAQQEDWGDSKFKKYR